MYLYRGADSFNRIYNGLDTRADALLVGCALGLAGYEFLSPRAWAILGMLGAAFVAYVLFFAYPVPGSFQVPFGLTIGGTLFAIGVALFLAGILSNSGSIPAKLLRFPPLVWAGQLSYGLYLWHFFVFAFIAGWFRGYSPRLIPAQLAATFSIAAISYYFLERPCLKLKKKFSVIQTREPSANRPI